MFLYWMEMPGNEQRASVISPMTAKWTPEEALNVNESSNEKKQ